MQGISLNTFKQTKLSSDLSAKSISSIEGKFVGGKFILEHISNLPA
jgi:hypothetical protein